MKRAGRGGAPFGADARRARCDHCGGAPDLGRGEDMRCGCGNLLARLVPGGVELKCRRCKRTVVLPLAPPGEGGTPEVR